jgi:hypothetical protein
MASVQQVPFVFPPPPAPTAVEWPGEPIGRSNVITRTRSRTKIHDKTIDRKPDRRDQLINAAIAHLITHAHAEPTYLHDVIIHGIRVRAITNSEHLIQFWRENWYGPEEWRRQTGREAPATPRIVVYAVGKLTDEAEAAYYSREANTIVFFNTSYYGQLKSWVLGAVGRVLASEFGIHSIHGACVERHGEGVLYIAPTGTGKSTSSYGLMTYPNTRFHSDDWVYLRYARLTKTDQLLVPVEVRSAKGETVGGYRCNPWIDAHSHAPGTARCLDLVNNEVTVELEDFDHGRPIQAYAYTSEKVFYLRSNLVENFPDTADAILRADLENVPMATPDFLRSNRPTIGSIARDLRESANSRIRAGLGAMPADSLYTLIGSLIAFDNARAMLDISAVFPPRQVYTNPMEPVRLSTVFLLRRDPTDRIVLRTLPIDTFMERLLIGQTPDGRREIAYNAYRVVDDDVEGSAVQALEREAQSTGAPLYQAFRRAASLPETLREEFALFEQLYQATLAYDCNTVLQQDPRVSSKKEAVRLTLDVILRGVENRSRELSLTLDTYRSQISR